MCTTNLKRCSKYFPCNIPVDTLILVLTITHDLLFPWWKPRNRLHQLSVYHGVERGPWEKKNIGAHFLLLALCSHTLTQGWVILTLASFSVCCEKIPHLLLRMPSVYFFKMGQVSGFKMLVLSLYSHRWFVLVWAGNSPMAKQFVRR